MSRILTALILTCLLGLATASVRAQTGTATPMPLVPAPTRTPLTVLPDDYEFEALQQLDNLRNVATGLYQMTDIPTDTVQSYVALLRDELYPFASSVTPPPAFAPFHTRLFMALRPCGSASTLVQRGGTDAFSVGIMSNYTLACFTAASDTSVEWSRATGTAPIFLPSLPSGETAVAVQPSVAPLPGVHIGDVQEPLAMAGVDDLGIPYQIKAPEGMILEKWKSSEREDGSLLFEYVVSTPGKKFNSDFSIGVNYFDSSNNELGGDHATYGGTKNRQDRDRRFGFILNCDWGACPDVLRKAAYYVIEIDVDLIDYP